MTAAPLSVQKRSNQILNLIPKKANPFPAKTHSVQSSGFFWSKKFFLQVLAVIYNNELTAVIKTVDWYADIYSRLISIILVTLK